MAWHSLASAGALRGATTSSRWPSAAQHNKQPGGWGGDATPLCQPTKDATWFVTHVNRHALKRMRAQALEAQSAVSCAQLEAAQEAARHELAAAAVAKLVVEQQLEVRTLHPPPVRSV